LGNEFYGSKVRVDDDHLASLFVIRILGNLALQREYYCYSKDANSVRKNEEAANSVRQNE
jgi:hypothetical protein